MYKKVLVVNGQRLNLKRCGGAGRYGEQLYKRIIDPSKVKELSGFDVFLPGFQEIDIDASVSSQDQRKTADLIKHIVYRCCPPIIFDRLQQVYQYTNQLVPSESGTEKDNTSFYPPWFSPSIPTLLHELTNYGMIDGIGRLSLSSNVRLAVTFLDIQDFYYPEYFQDASLSKRRLAYSYYKDRADFFFAISEFTKQTMVDRLNISPERIKVTPLAADDMLIIESSQEVDRWVESFGRYLIYPAKVWKHKNHEFLLKVVGKRRNELKRTGIKLLLTGGFSKNDFDHLEKIIRDNSLQDIVLLLGFVSDEQLQTLLRRAEFLVFPSLFEGFGMPILEAMTLGCPVLSSNAGSLPEVGGDAALYFDPKNEDEFVALIDSILTDVGVDRDSMIQKGFKNCKRFSWDKTYRETLDVYKELLR